MEHFYTLQGEGVFTGQAAYFIRLAGCDVGCVWCDVKESWPQNHPQLSSEELMSQVVKVNAPIVVVTGGEPLMHDLSPLTKAIKSHELRTHIETSGAHPMSGDWDWICLSPKKFAPVLKENYDLAQELKVIIYNTSDFQWAEKEAAKVPKDCRLLLQPEWSREKKMLPEMIAFVKNNPRWQISLQTHKYMDIP